MLPEIAAAIGRFDSRSRASTCPSNFSIRVSLGVGLPVQPNSLLGKRAGGSDRRRISASLNLPFWRNPWASRPAR